VKAVILAGGRGSRLSELTHEVPKPLVLVDENPILFHIMKIFAFQGVTDFMVLTGYKGHLISDFFLNFMQNMSSIYPINQHFYPESIIYDYASWKIEVIDTGESTMTGGRLLRAKKSLMNEDKFYFTYGDGLANVNLSAISSVNERKNTIATVTAVLPPSRFGKIIYENNLAKEFSEKPTNQKERINGGFFVLRPGVFDYIDDDTSVFENEPLSKICKTGQLSVYEHNGYWSCMDTVRDLEQIRKDSIVSPPPWLKNDF
jgi:glucose-1-phosphate cytidylyltransferase